MVRRKQAAGRVAPARCHSAVAPRLVPMGCHNTARGARAPCSDDTLATVHQLPYDQVTIYGVPPDAMVSNLAIPQDTLWTLYLHSEGTPGNLEACKERESTYYCICQY
jgi:hypothetical protein